MKYSGLNKNELDLIRAYKGYRHDHFVDGQLVSSTDTRDLQMEKLLAKQRIWMEYNEKIIELVPEHKQRNMALELLEQDEVNEYKSIIETNINEYNTRLKLISSCNSLQELDDSGYS